MVGIVGANPVAVRWNVVLTVFVDLSVVASRRVQNQPTVVHSVDDAHTHFAGWRPLQVFVGQRVDQQRGVVPVAEHQPAQTFEHLAAHEPVVVDVVELSAAVERARFFVEVDTQRVGIFEQRGIAHTAVEVQTVVADGTDSAYGPFGGVGGREESVKGINAPVDRAAQPQPLTVQIEVVFTVGFADFEDAESEGLCACVARRGTQFDAAVIHRRIAGRPYLSLGNGDCPTQGVAPGLEYAGVLVLEEGFTAAALDDAHAIVGRDVVRTVVFDGGLNLNAVAEGGQQVLDEDVGNVGVGNAGQADAAADTGVVFGRQDALVTPFDLLEVFPAASPARRGDADGQGVGRTVSQGCGHVALIGQHPDGVVANQPVVDKDFDALVELFDLQQHFAALPVVGQVKFAPEPADAVVGPVSGGPELLFDGGGHCAGLAFAGVEAVPAAGGGVDGESFEVHFLGQVEGVFLPWRVLVEPHFPILRGAAEEGFEPLASRGGGVQKTERNDEQQKDGHSAVEPCPVGAETEGWLRGG